MTRIVRTASGAYARARSYDAHVANLMKEAREWKKLRTQTDETRSLIRNFVIMARSYAHSARYYRNHARWLSRQSKLPAFNPNRYL